MWPPPEQPRLADRLADPRWRWEHGGVGGAERLLMELVKQGLDERALPAAAALVIELDLPRRHLADGSVRVNGHR